MPKRTDTRAYITEHRHAGVNRKYLPAASDTLGAVTVYMGGAALYDPVKTVLGPSTCLTREATKSCASTGLTRTISHIAGRPDFSRLPFDNP